ncbi:unnamed protein product, partial [marine sediment metagenome]
MNIISELKSNSIMNHILLLQITMIISIILNVPIIRQISSFISLTFIPGYLIFRKLKVIFNDFYNMFLISTGL